MGSRVRARVLLAVAASACLLVGCGSNQADQVRAKVTQFERAVAAHDASTICRQVLAPWLAQRFAAGGLSCQRGMQIFFQSVTDPTLSIGRITIDRNRATVLVLTGARCQRLALAQLYLVNTSAGWRISSESREPPGKPSC